MAITACSRLQRRSGTTVLVLDVTSTGAIDVHRLGRGEGQPVAPVPHRAGREQLAAIGWDRAKAS